MCVGESLVTPSPTGVRSTCWRARSRMASSPRSRSAPCPNLTEFVGDGAEETRLIGDPAAATIVPSGRQEAKAYSHHNQSIRCAIRARTHSRGILGSCVAATQQHGAGQYHDGGQESQATRHNARHVSAPNPSRDAGDRETDRRVLESLQIRQNLTQPPDPELDIGDCRVPVMHHQSTYLRFHRIARQRGQR